MLTKPLRHVFSHQGFYFSCIYLAGADEGRQYERERDQSGSGGARGRGRPPGLRGKDIGMYYARMGRAKRASKDRAQVFSQGLKFYNFTESSC